MTVFSSSLSLFLTRVYTKGRTAGVKHFKQFIGFILPSPTARGRAYHGLYLSYQKLFFILRQITFSGLRSTTQINYLLRLALTNPLHPTLLNAFDLNIPSPKSNILSTSNNINSAESRFIGTNSSVFLLAAGQGVRWQGEGLKQLAVINGQPVIARTLKQVPQGIVISHHQKLHHFPHAIPTRHAFVLETLLSTQNHWGERTIILLGDVVFDSRDLQTILKFDGDFAVFGSRSQVEIFALSFTQATHSKILHHLYRALEDAYHGGRGKLWEFYHSYEGLPFHSIGFGRHFLSLTHTTDIDTIEDYDRIIHGRSLKSYH